MSTSILTLSRSILQLGLVAVCLLGAIPAHAAPPTLADLEQRNAELERRLADQTAAAERYRRGLERAVDELNRIRAQRLDATPTTTTTSTSPTEPSSPSPRPAVLTRGAALWNPASVRVEQRRAVAYGELRNPRAEPIHGTATIELLRDGIPINSASYRVELPPSSTQPFAHRFPLEGYAAAVYTARVEILLE